MSKIEDEAKKQITSGEVKSLGKVEKYITNTEKSQLHGSELGYKTISIKDLPTKGYFYKKDLKISIRSARIGEIRHWSTIEESDPISVDSMLNFIMEKCVRVTSISGNTSYKDLKEMDRLFLLFAVRELTFINGQNNLQAEYYDDDVLKTVVLKKEMISYFEMPEDFIKYYSESQRCFIFINPNDESEKINIYFPSIGMASIVDTWKRGREQNRRMISKDFSASVQFLTPDWKNLTESDLDELYTSSNNWSLWKISLLSYVTSKIMEFVDPTMTIKKENGEEDILPLNFQGGLKAIFIIPNPLG